MSCHTRALKPNKTPGLDGMHPTDLKEELVSPLADLMNKSIKEETLPQAWTDALVSPIFKKAVVI